MVPPYQVGKLFSLCETWRDDVIPHIVFMSVKANFLTSNTELRSLQKYSYELKGFKDVVISNCMRSYDLCFLTLFYHVLACSIPCHEMKCQF